MTYLTVWHYVVMVVVLLMFVAGAIVSFGQKKKKLVLPMLFSVTLVSVAIAILMMFVVDKYTKHVELYKLKNKRILSLEKIVYRGIVKNTGNYTIGEVTFNIKLVSRGKSGNLESTTFYKSSGFLDMFSGVTKSSKGSNTIEKSFVVAKNLKPGQVKSFRVYFRYPPNFRNVSEYAKVSGH